MESSERGDTVMAPEDRRLVEIFMNAQDSPPGRLFSENVLAGIKAILGHSEAGVAVRGKLPTTEAHRQRHLELYRALDELLADYMKWAPFSEHNFLEMSVRRLLQWAHRETIDPTEKR